MQPLKSIALTLVILGASTAGAQQNDGLKIFISADMEGVVGAVTGEQLGPGGFEYERFRQFMTDEVNAAIDAARAAGATEFVVADAHGNGQNLLIEQLPDDVTVVRSWPRPDPTRSAIPWRRRANARVRTRTRRPPRSRRARADR